MRRALVLVTTLLGLAAGFRRVSGCLDVTPIVVEHDAKGTDGSCLLCLQEPQNCRGLIEQCEGDPRCGPVYACMVQEACLDMLTLNDKIQCGLPCAQDAGIVSTTDPVISTYLVGLVACGQERCAAPCNLPDGGIGL